MRVMVTGSAGYIARRVVPLLEAAGHEVVPFDLPDHDVREEVGWLALSCDACIHLAGMKYADRAEIEPLETVDVNVLGTANIIAAFQSRLVLASTCKAADPETVYGCSKLIAERMVLEAGGRIVRLVNVLGSAGSVTDIWDAVPEGDPIPVCAGATRMFMSEHDAAALFVDALDWPSGRYAPRAPEGVRMSELAGRLHPGRPTVTRPLRRGDRRHERLLAACERQVAHTGKAVRIIGQHDPVMEGAEDAGREVRVLRRV